MIKVLIVDDSPTIRLFLEYIFRQDSEIEVVGKLSDGKQAVQEIKKFNPDIITMDIDMPIMNGLEATRQIMASNPVPIIVITASTNARDVKISMEALAAGALSVIEKPKGGYNPENIGVTSKLIRIVKTYSKVKVVKRTTILHDRKATSSIPKEQELIHEIPSPDEWKSREYIAIGISTGGPEVLKKIIGQVTENFPYPILVVQHITDGFLEGMVSWLDSFTTAKVKIAAQGEIPGPGIIYFAPNNYNMGVVSNRINLIPRESGSLFCPSVQHLFYCLMKNYARQTIALLLTGMGNDGAAELKQLRDEGALTIAQDKKSSVVFGMPNEAIKLKGAKYVLNLEQISGMFSLMNSQKNS